MIICKNKWLGTRCKAHYPQQIDVYSECLAWNPGTFNLITYPRSNAVAHRLAASKHNSTCKCNNGARAALETRRMGGYDKGEARRERAKTRSKKVKQQDWIRQKTPRKKRSEMQRTNMTGEQIGIKAESRFDRGWKTSEPTSLAVTQSFRTEVHPKILRACCDALWIGRQGPVFQSAGWRVCSDDQGTALLNLPEKIYRGQGARKETLAECKLKINVNSVSAAVSFLTALQ